MLPLLESSGPAEHASPLAYSERVLLDLSVLRVQRGDEVGPEKRGLIIALNEGHPCRAALTRPRKLQATHQAGSSRRKQPAPKRRSACLRCPGSVAGSVLGVAPGRDPTGAHTAWSGATGLLPSSAPANRPQAEYEACSSLTTALDRPAASVPPSARRIRQRRERGSS
jgi:hypothetical protein